MLGKLGIKKRARITDSIGPGQPFTGGFMLLQPV